MLLRSSSIITILICMLSSLSCLAEVIEIRSEKTFNDELKKGKPVVVKFYATWCGPCKRLKPVFEELSNKAAYSDVIFLAVDVDKHEGLTSKYGIRGMPTTVFLDASGKEIKRIAGGENFMKEASKVIDTKLLVKPAAESKDVPKKKKTKKE